MRLIDLHCDTIHKMCNNKGSLLCKNDFNVDIEKLKKAGSMAQVFALFVNLKDGDPLMKGLELIDIFYNELEKNKEKLSLARNYKEIMKNEEEGKISAILSIEEGAVLKGELYNLRNFYRLGVRLVTLTWNYKNELGFPNSKGDDMKLGLTERGIEFIHEMNRLGMIIDVSHLSDGGFYDVVKYSKAPFIASHSDSRTIKDHQRNLTDEMVKIISDKGGIIGINFASGFLGDSPNGNISEMIEHINHFNKIGGIDCISMGTDFDGIGNVPDDVPDMSYMPRLYDALLKEGYSEDEVDKIFYKNALRVIKDVLK